jgi:hypothetical protein
MYAMDFRKGWRGSVAVRGAALGDERAGGGAAHGVPEPPGKQRGALGRPAGLNRTAPRPDGGRIPRYQYAERIIP